MLQPSNLAVIGGALTVEQFGYGFGFTAYMVYMMMVSAGEHRTAHYAICTGFMALGMMLPGLPAGWIQDHFGYVKFFIWVCIATLPSFAATALIKVDPTYGRATRSTAKAGCSGCPSVRAGSRGQGAGFQPGQRTPPAPAGA